ncbi:MAG: helical backbone metal receptor [Elusimicrobiales bacterium]|nr:helical backbone metal receptor [Elusimicrobiales bacterium]
MKKFLLLFYCLLTLDSFGFSQKIISLMPSYTEIIIELGGGDKLVGVTRFCRLPDNYKEIKIVGDYLNPNIELIYSLKPDIIFIGEWKNNIIEKFAKDKKIKIVIIPTEKSIEDIYSTIKIISKNINRENEAFELIKKMKAELKKYNIFNKKFKKVYVEIDRDFWTCGSESFISDVISKAGGINVFNDIKKSYFKTTWEEVVKRNPDVVLIMSGESVDSFLSRHMSDKLNAFKTKKILSIDEKDRDMLSRPSPSVILMVKKLHNYISNEN